MTDIGVSGSVAMLAPGLVLVGAGMGLVITPLTTIVMGAVGPEHAGSASGALSTMQNAATPPAWRSSACCSSARAAIRRTRFAVSVGALARCAGVAALTRLLPPPPAS